ncbi:MAG TPA: hypothetical protein VHZ54_14020 [Solirubrobacterales bacterium]|jgi:hypothetical protein|nr:hypothetical protein [Solirubrobacterales bacterium]
MRGRREKTARIALIALASAALLGAASPAASPAAKQPKKTRKAKAAPGPFCSAPVVDNYWAPAEKLQTLPAVPEGGVLGFAPAGTTLGGTGPRLLVGASNVGFRFADGGPEPASGKPRRLNWTVLGRLIRLTDEGHNLHPTGLKRIDLKQLPTGKHRGFAFPIPATPALYSLEVTIQNGRGRLLGRYGEYVRVVSRIVNVGVTLATYDKVAPGSYLESCFENHGTASVTPTGTSLERNESGTWRPVVVGPQYSPAQTPIQRTLGPGEAERIGTLVPPNARPGLYRLTANGTTELGEPVVIGAEFGVL